MSLNKYRLTIIQPIAIFWTQVLWSKQHSFLYFYFKLQAFNNTWFQKYVPGSAYNWRRRRVSRVKVANEQQHSNFNRTNTPEIHSKAARNVLLKPNSTINTRKTQLNLNLNQSWTNRSQKKFMQIEIKLRCRLQLLNSKLNRKIQWNSLSVVLVVNYF